MNKFGWFLTGLEVCGMIVAVLASFYNLGSVDVRVFLFVWGLLGIGFNIAFLKEERGGKR